MFIVYAIVIIANWEDSWPNL